MIFGLNFETIVCMLHKVHIIFCHKLISHNIYPHNSTCLCVLYVFCQKQKKVCVICDGINLLKYCYYWINVMVVLCIQFHMRVCREFITSSWKILILIIMQKHLVIG